MEMIGILSAMAAGKKIGISANTLISYIGKGILPAEIRRKGIRRWYYISEIDLRSFETWYMGEADESEEISGED